MCFSLPCVLITLTIRPFKSQEIFKSTFMNFKFPLALLLALAWSTLNAQLGSLSLSPLTSLKQEVGNTTITIDFERPAARGRQIFGGLVPWNEVWRTGAGYCTKIDFSRDVVVGAQPVMAGKYSLLTVPGEEEWIIILNKDTTLYGSRDYDSTKDVIRFRTPARKAGRYFEALSLDLDITPDDARMYISWADVQVSFPIETTTEREAFAYIDSLMAEPLNEKADYAWPAEYLLLKQQNINQVIALADRQLAIEESEYALSLKAEAYAYLGYPKKALMEIDKGIALVKRRYADQPKQLAPTLEYWMGRRAKILKDQPPKH